MRLGSVAFVILLLAPGVVLGAFIAHQLVFLFLSLIASLRRPATAASSACDTRFVVVVPAHDEEGLIAGTVRSILDSDYPVSRIELIVIADNCTDRTAELARANGAVCLERTEPQLRGKPHALDWLISRLDLTKYDALVIVDADTRVHREFLRRMSAHLQSGPRALQGYFGVLNPDQNWLTRLSRLPGTLKYRLYYPGKELAGLSCPLAGNGMCFGIEIIRAFGWKAYSLTENWEYWAQLTLHDIRVGVAADAVIYSEVPVSLSAGRSQRIRWMKGRIETLRNYGGRLLRDGLREPSVMKLDALLELARPSHAMLLTWSLVYAGILLILWSLGQAQAAIVLFAAALIALQLGYFLAGFVLERPPLRAWLALLMVPWYLLWKLAISLRGVLGMRDRTWVRTRRND